ncbi:transposase family protein [Streptomyces sp. LBUM 1485]|nr:transposase family protein [Streptomyces sp. LBUM 1485]
MARPGRDSDLPTGALLLVNSGWLLSTERTGCPVQWQRSLPTEGTGHGRGGAARVRRTRRSHRDRRSEDARARRRQSAGAWSKQASRLRELRRQAVLELLKPEEATVRSVAKDLGVSPTTIQDIKTSYSRSGRDREKKPAKE